MEGTSKLQELLAKALASVEAEEFRAIIGECVAQTIRNYDMQRLIHAAVEPIVKEMIKEQMKNPQVLDSMAAKVKHALLLAGVKITELR